MKIKIQSNEREGVIKNIISEACIGFLKVGSCYFIIRDCELITVKSFGLYRNRIKEETLECINEVSDKTYHLNMID